MDLPHPTDFFNGVFIGFLAWFGVRCIFTGFFTVEQNERAVLTTFGRAERLEGHTTLEDPISESLSATDRERYAYPLLQVIPPGGPYFKMPWQKVHKVSIAIEAMNIAYDPDFPMANQQGTVLEAVTKDQLNIGVTGQFRYFVSESNLYAYLFGVKNPIAHVLGYFISILRERIATFDTPQAVAPALPSGEAAPVFEGISINDLRKNLNDINTQMDRECHSSAARYGIVLDASLITGIDPPQEIDSALAAINTAHNEVSAEISTAQAQADQRIVESRQAVEIQTLRAQTEVQPLRWLAEQLHELKKSGPDAIPAYLRNIRLDLYKRAERIILEMKK